MLKQVVLALVSILSPVFATIVALRSSDEVGSSCTLEKVQALALQTVAQTFFNSTCTFNITIGPDGVRQW